MDFVPAIPLVFLLAWANGANDNLKCASTLLGSGVVRYRRAVAFATLCAALGSLAAGLLASKLFAAFGPAGLTGNGAGLPASAAGAAVLAATLTVLAATRIGLPVSTTHALLGALLGAGWASSGAPVDAGRLGTGFLLPLASSPVLAALLAWLATQWLQPRDVGPAPPGDLCLCIEPAPAGALATAPAAGKAARAGPAGLPGFGEVEACRSRGARPVAAFSRRRIAEGAHFLSSGAVGFARALNDTPKIAALLVAARGLGVEAALGTVAAAMALGGLMAARRVAETLAYRVTAMDPADGLAANLVTATLVVGASVGGLPVSTTHVSCGSLFGIGIAGRRVNRRMVRTVLLAWIATLPLAAGLAAVLAGGPALFG